MLGYIEGQVLHQDETKVLVKTTQGLGYEVFYNQRVEENSCSLYLSQIFKEKSVELYGFKTLVEKKNFELLLGVNGVGPKSAFSLISTLGVENLSDAIAMEDVATIKKAPGIGPKAAKQVILDLKGKIATNGLELTGASTNSMVNSFSIYQEAMGAFKELGFNEIEIAPVLKEKIKQGNFKKPEDLIRVVLQEINH